MFREYATCKSSINNNSQLNKEVKNKRLRAKEMTYDLKFSRDLRGGVTNILNAIGRMLEEFIKGVSEPLAPHDFIRLVIISPELRDPIGLPWALVRDLDVEAILQIIEKVL